MLQLRWAQDGTKPPFILEPWVITCCPALRQLMHFGMDLKRYIDLCPALVSRIIEQSCAKDQSSVRVVWRLVSFFSRDRPSVLHLLPLIWILVWVQHHKLFWGYPSVMQVKCPQYSHLLIVLPLTNLVNLSFRCGVFQMLSIMLGLLLCLKVDKEMVQQIIKQFQFYLYLVKSSKRSSFLVSLLF